MIIWYKRAKSVFRKISVCNGVWRFFETLVLWNRSRTQQAFYSFGIEMHHDNKRWLSLYESINNYDDRSRGLNTIGAAAAKDSIPFFLIELAAFNNRSCLSSEGGEEKSQM